MNAQRPNVVVEGPKGKKKVIVASTSLDEERWHGRQRLFILAIAVIFLMSFLDMASDYNMYLQISDTIDLFDEIVADVSRDPNPHSMSSPQTANLINEFNKLGPEKNRHLCDPSVGTRMLLDQDALDSLRGSLGHVSRASIVFCVLSLPFAFYHIYSTVYASKRYLRWNDLDYTNSWNYHVSTVLVQLAEDIPQNIITIYYVIANYFPDGVECLHCTVKFQLCALSPVADPLSGAELDDIAKSMSGSAIPTLYENSAIVFSVFMTFASITVSALMLSWNWWARYLSKGYTKWCSRVTFGVLSLLTVFLYFTAVCLPLLAVLYFEVFPLYGAYRNFELAFLMITGSIVWIIGIIIVIVACTCGC